MERKTIEEGTQRRRKGFNKKKKEAIKAEDATKHGEQQSEDMAVTFNTRRKIVGRKKIAER